MSEAAAKIEPTTTPYQLIGGEAGVRRLVDRFYDIMDSAPDSKTLRAMHETDLGPMRKRLFEFLSGWLGGPRLYSGCVMSAHRALEIGAAERDQWLKCMERAMAETAVDHAARKLLEQPLLRMADAMRSH